jgi:hypothetical protein
MSRRMTWPQVKLTSSETLNAPSGQAQLSIVGCAIGYLVAIPQGEMLTYWTKDDLSAHRRDRTPACPVDADQARKSSHVP